MATPDEYEEAVRVTSDMVTRFEADIRDMRSALRRCKSMLKIAQHKTLDIKTVAEEILFINNLIIRTGGSL